MEEDKNSVQSKAVDTPRGAEKEVADTGENAQKIKEEKVSSQKDNKILSLNLISSKIIGRRKNLFIILTGVFAISIVMLVISVAFQNRQNKKLQPKKTPIPSPTEGTLIVPRVSPYPTKGPFFKWKTYKNKEISYEIGYPPEWTVQNADPQKSPYSIDEKTISVNILRLDEIGGYFYHLISIKPTQIKRGFIYDDWLNSLKGINLKSKEVYQQELNGTQMDVIVGDSLGQEKQYHLKIFAFKSQYDDYAVSILVRFPITEEKNEEIEKILSTFKVLEKIETPTPMPTPIPSISPEDLFNQPG